jgi:hypothetical protein
MKSGVRPFVIMAVFLALAASQGTGGDGQMARVSIIELIATPRVWDGKLVRVQGFCHIEFEETGLYLHREDADLMNSLNGVWLEVDLAKYKSFNEQFVVVEGRFAAGPQDHLGIWRGSIRDVIKIALLPSRSAL